jgi:hypothetical protein
MVTGRSDSRTVGPWSGRWMAWGGAVLLSVGPTVRPSDAQVGPEPNLVLTLFGGAVTGGNIWTIERQPVCLMPSCSPYDTLRLARDLSSSITIGVAMSYFLTPKFGIQGEVAYLGLPLRDACAVVGAGTQRTAEVCGNIQGASHTTGSVSFLASALFRVIPRASLSPYLRAGWGVVTIDQSTIDVAGPDASGQVYQVIRDDSPRRLALSLVFGGGVTFALGPGYQFRLEVRDVVAGFERMTGAADNLGFPPIGSRSYHHLALSMGLDVVLERKRGRRY